jgi:hypothetical protein
MRRNRTSRSRGARLLGVLALAAAVAAALAAPAGAVSSSGSAEIVTADHDRGRTLSGQGGKLAPAAGTSLEDGKLTLPVPELDPAQGTAGQAGNLRFRKGKRGVALTGIHFDFSAGTLNGSLGGEEMAVFKLGTGSAIDPLAGTAVLSEGVLRFTGEAARIVRRKLGLKRALRHNGVGMIWLNARANPIQVTRPIASGALDWGFRESWRSYVLNVPPAGSAEVSGGATATGPLTSTATTYGFPAAAGSFARGLYGAGDSISLSTIGAVKWAKPGHGIDEVRLSDLEIRIGGAESWLIADVRTEIGPPAESKDVRFAQLDAGAVAPVFSADGNTVTWAQIPATLTVEGASSFSGFYEAGDPLDPVTISVGLG